VVPDIRELQSDTPFAILVRNEPERVEEIHYSRLGLVELKKEDKEKLGKKYKEKLEEIVINLNARLKQNANVQKISNNKKVFLGGTCNKST